MDVGEFGVGDFGDRRLNRAGAALHACMVQKQTVCLRRLGGDRAGEMRFGRFIHNPRVSVAGLVAGVCQEVGARARGRHVLAIEDSSELNYQAHAGRVRALGTVGNGVDAGLFLHPVLVVDAEERACLGLAHVQVWRRFRAKAKHYRALPIEQKESGRWLAAAQAAGARLQEAAKVTVVADREADIYEMWARLPDARTELLIRACRDRRLVTETGARLFAWLSALPVRASYHLALPAVAGQRAAHVALLHVRFSPVTIRRPLHGSDPDAPDTLSVWAIDVREDPTTAVGEEAAIHWRLLTTHPVRSVAMAQQCIDWYSQRWHIEQLFRTLKRQGLDLESSLIEDGPALERLAVLAVAAATRTMQLTLARDGQTRRPAQDAFSTEEIGLLHHLQPTLEGQTAKQKNPHPPPSLAWAAWIIARLGGWKGYASERKPGPITFLHGQQAFERIHQGWRLSQVQDDVCIQ